MAYTRHGHHIPGTTLDERPTMIARCGGVGMCTFCTNEAEDFKHTFGFDETDFEDSSMFLGSSEMSINQIPPAPLSDEDLRLECLGLAVERSKAFSGAYSQSVDLIELAKKYVEFVRPTP